MRLFLCLACLIALALNGQTPLAIALLAVAAILAALSWALEPVVAWMEGVAESLD